MAEMRSYVSVAVLASVGTSCSPAPAHPAGHHEAGHHEAGVLALPTLTLIGDANLAADAAGGKVPVGGLSDLCFRPEAARLLALSDDRAKHGPARFYELSVTLAAPSLGLHLERSVELSGSEDFFGAGRIDPEGIALAPGGGLLISTEGDGETDPRIPPRLSKVDTNGAYQGQVTVPERFAPTPRGPQLVGVRDNEGFEGLTTTPSGRWVFMSNEQALVQDGAEATFSSGTMVRIVRYDQALTPVAEHAYLTDAIPAAAGNVGTAVLGVSALMALDDRRLWVLERAGVAIDDVFENRLRIYQVDVSRALDVSQKPSVTTSDALPKSLVLDLDDVTARLHPPKLDNFEGMALGPRTEKGQRSVVLVSDDNFKATQRTALVAFALEE